MNKSSNEQLYNQPHCILNSRLNPTINKSEIPRSQSPSIATQTFSNHYEEYNRYLFEQEKEEPEEPSKHFDNVPMRSDLQIFARPPSPQNMNYPSTNHLFLPAKMKLPNKIRRIDTKI